MVKSVCLTVWLCWITCSLLPLVQCQLGDIPFGSSPFTGGFGRLPVGDGFPNLRLGGGRPSEEFIPNLGSQRNRPVGGNGPERPQEGQEQQQPENTGQANNSPERNTVDAGARVPLPAEDPSPPAAAPSSRTLHTPKIPAPTSVDAADATLPLEGISSPSFTPVRAVPAVPSLVADQPTTVAETPISGAIAPNLAPSSESIPTTSNGLLTSPSAAAQPLPTASTTTTTTASMTILITPSPEPALPSSNSESTAQSDSVAAMDPAPVSTSTAPTMSASARAGVGVGVTFGIVSIASAAGFYLWRRRRNQKYESNKRGGGLFRFNRSKTAKSDAEWEIGDAETVEILRGASARTVSRSDSRSTRPSRDGSGGSGGDTGKLQILKVGMRVPTRPNPALTSNPPISPSEFPTPPSSRGYLGSEQKASGWPLSV